MREKYGKPRDCKVKWLTSHHSSISSPATTPGALSNHLDGYQIVSLALYVQITGAN